ncbi:MAG: 30S ribosomal protein S9 [Proteobacteria bacterium]|nr:30S ribosomal protein S9 [Pseudomonadota bacterium]
MAIKPTNTTGRRKTASARVYLVPTIAENEEDKGKIVVNGMPLNKYFNNDITQMVLRQPLELTDRLTTYDMKITVAGGGKSGQAGAVLHGIARALERIEPDLRPLLKKAGFLTRDQRSVERKKPGRHKARKRPQFSKR